MNTMDPKLLKKAVIFGLILHIVIVVFYIASHNTGPSHYSLSQYHDQIDRQYLTRETFEPQRQIGETSILMDEELKKEISNWKHSDFDDEDSRISDFGSHDSERFLEDSMSLDEGNDLSFHGNDKTNLEEIKDLRDGTLKDNKGSVENDDGGGGGGGVDETRSKSSSSSSLLLSPSSSSSSSLSSSSFLSSSLSSSSLSSSLSSSSLSSPDIDKHKTLDIGIGIPPKTLRDETHPLFNKAFSRNVIPPDLLHWAPSPDSPKYFRKIKGVNAFMYAAYWTRCTPASIRLIGLSARKKPTLGDVFCHFFDAKENWTETRRGSLRALKDNHLLNQTAAAVECPLTPNVRPRFVIVTKDNKFIKTTYGLLPVQYPAEKASRNFTLCFSPLHSRYNFTFQLVQSIELNRLLGASHFLFYNFSTSPQTDEILRYYQGQGLATVLPWPLPHLDSWYYGQIAAINDCIYRNKVTSRYVVIVDTDEFIIPNKHSNWFDLLHDVTTSPELRDIFENPNNVPKESKKCYVQESEDENRNKFTQNATKSSPLFGSFMFRCSFFADKPLTPREKDLLKTKGLYPTRQQTDFFKLYRSAPMIYLKSNDEIYKHESRSKLIVRPEAVLSHAIHKTVDHVDGYKTAYVNPSAAFLHHYRPYKIKSLNTLDTSALKFKDKLYERLKSLVKRFPAIFGRVSKTVLGGS